mmetsp:Transcript_38686/g.92568  ORF Transcript_38686/g.92568 Transcript_38686/m.92568 type:complete len:94 (-) Transcript_38686:154-435(-)
MCNCFETDASKTIPTTAITTISNRVISPCVFHPSLRGEDGTTTARGDLYVERRMTTFVWRVQGRKSTESQPGNLIRHQPAAAQVQMVRSTLAL